MRCLAIATLLVVALPASAALYPTQAALDAAPGFAFDPVFDSVAAITAIDGEGDEFPLGSGVLVAPDIVITSARAVLDIGMLVEADLRVSFARFLLDPGRVPLVVASAAIHPGFFDEAPAGEEVDLAILFLASPLVSPVPSAIGVADPSDRVRVAGYGAPGVLFNEGFFDATMRGGENLIDCVGCNTLSPGYFEADYDTIPAELPLPLEWRASTFDDGAGWFNDAGELVAIGGGWIGTDRSIAVELDQFGAWINSTTGLQLVPEPGVALGLLTGISTLGALQRRRRSRAPI